MLREFLSHNRDELIERCRFKVAMRRAPRATPRELSHGVPLFLDQLTEVFARSTPQLPGGNSIADGLHVDLQIAQTAARHGRELLKHDFTIEQVVHDYGDLCQSITELAFERGAPITVTEFGSLNNTLDNAIASAVASYSAEHQATPGGANHVADKERLGALANAMRNLLNTAILASSAMKRGNVGPGGATAAALTRSLTAMRGLIDRALADVRLEANFLDAVEVIEIGPFIAAVKLAAVLEATSTQCELTVMAQPDIFVRGDRHLLASAVANLLRGAVTSTKRDGELFVAARAQAGRVIIEIEDTCTCHTTEVLREMVACFDQRATATSAFGSVLDSARRAVEANFGTLSVKARESRGCLYTIDLAEAE